MQLRNDFGVWDYVVFAAALCVSLGIGIFFAFRSRRQQTQANYLMGGGNLSVVPVAISMLVSFMSAILILGTPAEMYTQGTMYWMAAWGNSLGVLLASVLWVPLLYPLKLTSAFEYLERRYESKGVRLLVSCITIVAQLLYIGLAIFSPSTALEAVTGFPVWASIVICSFVSIVYTSIGGMSAVIWTDVFQAMVMLAGILAIIIQGTIKVGGFGKVWEINREWNRISFFDFNPDPRVRHTFWGLIFGSMLVYTGTYGINQPIVQRYSSLSSLQSARISVILNIFGVMFFITLVCISGLVMFAYYTDRNCSPLILGYIDQPNQLVPYFVMEILGYPGVPGLFIASVFCGGLSSVSTALNSLAAITWEDMVKTHLHRLSEFTKTLVIKMMVVIYGCLGIGVAILVGNLEGTVLQAALGLLGVTAGPMAGVFYLGAFFPWANKYGAMVGSILAFCLSGWMAIGAYVTGLNFLKMPYPMGEYCIGDEAGYNLTLLTSNMTETTTISPTSLTSSSTCIPGFNTTTATAMHAPEKGALDDYYDVSYLWFFPFGVATTIIVGLIVSFITGHNKTDDVPLKYQIPVFTRLLPCLPKSWQNFLNCGRQFESPEDYQERTIDYVVVAGSEDLKLKTGLDHVVFQDKDSSHVGFQGSYDKKGVNSVQMCQRNRKELCDVTPQESYPLNSRD